jgi:hypothetical protein
MCDTDNFSLERERLLENEFLEGPRPNEAGQSMAD